MSRLIAAILDLLFGAVEETQQICFAVEDLIENLRGAVILRDDAGRFRRRVRLSLDVGVSSARQQKAREEDEDDSGRVTMQSSQQRDRLKCGDHS